MADAGRQMNGSILNRGSSTTVVVGEGLLSGLPRITGLDEPPFVVADEITGPLFADFIGERCGLLNLPRGEGTKSLDSLSKIYASLATAGIDRSGTIVALGGGVVGDTAGFAASTWMRGVTLIQCPTTLLAQIDSAIGGKTAVNLPEGKNLVGSFHPARWVVSDVECLRSQADDDFRQGLAEAVKYGMGEDWSFFRWLEENARPVLRRALPALKTLVAECSRMKLAVVDEDERETTGVRARLNLGHTVGHALEAASGYRWRHGDAVAAGMMVAARISIRMGTLREEELSRLDRLLTVFRIPHRPDIEWDELVPFLARDKKFHSGTPRMVLPRSGEQCTLSSVSMDDIREAYGK